MPTAEEILKKVQGFLKPEDTEVKMAEVITSDGVTIYFDGELLEGSTVYTIVEGENVALPVGEYELPDETVLVVSEAGVVAQIMPKQETEKPNEVPEEAETTLSKEDVSTMIEEALAPLLAQLQEMSKVKEEKEELETQLSEEPAVEEIKPSPEGNDKDTVGVALNSKAKTTGLDRVYEMLYNGK